MASTNTWQKATNTAALAAADRVALGVTDIDAVSIVDLRTLVDFTQSRAQEDLATIAAVESLIDELDAARAAGAVLTYGDIQERLRSLLAGAAPEGAGL